jgi:predicted  nucleic acid-binding Zn ribbon protein
MEQDHLEILLEDIRGKFELVLEGHTSLHAKIDANQAKAEERFDHVDFQLKTLNTKIDLVKADLAAHRADTEAHPRWQVREPSE